MKDLNRPKKEDYDFNDNIEGVRYAKDMNDYADKLEEQLRLCGVGSSLPNKEAFICEGYNKAKNEDYKNRNSLRHKSQDDYYSGWMDCYDFIKDR